MAEEQEAERAMDEGEEEAREQIRFESDWGVLLAVCAAGDASSDSGGLTTASSLVQSPSRDVGERGREGRKKDVLRERGRAEAWDYEPIKHGLWYPLLNYLNNYPS